MLLFVAGCVTGLKIILDSSKKSSSSPSPFFQGIQLMIRGARDRDQETLAKGIRLVQKGGDKTATDMGEEFIEDSYVSFVSDEGNEGGDGLM